MGLRRHLGYQDSTVRGARRYVALVATVPAVGADVGGTPVQFFFVGDSSTGSESPGSTPRD